MKRTLLFTFFILNSLLGFSQVITTSTTAYTVPQLVQNVLFGGTNSGSCAGTISNVTWRTGNTNGYGSTNGIGYFENTNGNFPLTSGVILTSGSVLNAPGNTPGGNSTTLMDGNNAWIGDTQLFNYIQGLGIDSGLSSYNNASVLEFDFVPLNASMSFDFLFASEEYGTYQCTFSDAFAFFLTNVTAGTPAVNLALVPSSTTPVSVITIRDDAHNNGCVSQNPLYFDKYYGAELTGLNPTLSPTDFNGHTVLMTANSSVIPNNTYHIKFVIADRNDNILDSAVFLGGGSFDIGQANISGTVEGSEDFSGINSFTIAGQTALCFQSTRLVKAGTAPIPGATYQWSLNGTPISGATNYNYTISEPGTYEVAITLGVGCVQTDTIIAEYLPAMPLANPVDLFSGSTNFNLNLNVANILNGQSGVDYIINFHNSLADAQGVIGAIASPNNYIGYDGEVVFVSIQDDASGTDCRETRSFILHIQAPSVTTPPDKIACDDISNDGQEIFDFTSQTPIALGSYSASDYTITYHTSQLDADNDTGAISPINNYLGTNGQTIFVRMEENADPSAYDTTSFQLSVTPINTITINTVGTNVQTVCINTAITNIVYTTTGATGATFSGLPSGVSGSFNANTVTIVGSPNTTVGSPFNYTVTLTGGCGVVTTSGAITVTPDNTITLNVSGTNTQTVCVNTPITTITYTTTGATGATFAGLPSGVNGSFAGNTVTITGTPTTAVGSPFNYTVTLTGGCGIVTASGTITVTPINTIVLNVAGTNTQNVCVNTPITNIVYTTTGATGATFTGLPLGVNGSFTGNTVTIAGTPTTAVGSPFNYTVTLTGGCGVVTASGTITVILINTIALNTIGTNTQTVCVNTPITPITYTTTGATGATFAGLPSGVNGSFTGNTVTIAGTPSTAVGSPFNYTVTLTGGCGVVTASGTITVTPINTIALNTIGTNTQTVCLSTAITNIVYTTTGATGATFTGLPSGVNGSFAGNTVTIAGTPNTTAGSPFNYTVTLTGGCGVVTASGTITVTPINTIALNVAGTNTQTVCVNTAITNIVYTTTGATGATFAGLPSGVNGSFAGNTVTISGTPGTAVGSPFNYTVTLTGGCGVVTASGTITVTPINTIALNVAGTNTQSVCSNTPITNIVYTTTGATGATFSGLPSGVNGSFSGNTVTISGAPGTTVGSPFNYIVTLTGGCGIVTSSGTITVTPIPSASITISTSSVCMNYPSPTVTLTGTGGTAAYTFVYSINTVVQPSVTTTSGDSYIISVPTNVVGPFTYELISVSDANLCGQNINQSVSVNVLTAPLFNTPIDYELCDDDSNDGVACFDLAGVVTPQVTSDTSLEVSYHETFAGAELGLYDIPLTTPYCNINSINIQTIYIRIFNPSAPQCPSITSFKLIVHPKPTAVEPTDLHKCDDDDAQLGYVTFDLTSKASEILGSINSATHTITYYESLSNAQTPTSAIGTPSSYTNTVINTQTIWVRVENNATGCFDIVELQLVVDPLPLISQPACAAYSLCDTTGLVGYEEFDLSTKVACILNGQLGVSVHFYPSLAQAISGSNEITNLLYTNAVPVVQSLGVRVVNDATGCFDTSILDIRVVPLPVPIPLVQPYTVCDVDDDGFSQFNLATLSSQILGSASGTTISYHLTEASAEANQFPIDITLPYSNGVAFIDAVYVRVTNTTTGCYDVMKVDLIVNPEPIMPVLSNLPAVCDDQDSNNQDASTFVNLTQQTAAILAAQTFAGSYTVTYYETLAGATTQTGNIVSTSNYDGTDGQTIWVVVKHNTTGCFVLGSFQLVINSPLALVTPTALSLCDDDANPNNSFTIFDLTVKESEILGGQIGLGYVVTYYPEYPVTSSSIAIPNPQSFENTIAAVQDIGVVVTTPEGCKSTLLMNIRVLPIPSPQTTNIPVIEACDYIAPTGTELFNLTLNQAYIGNSDPGLSFAYFTSYQDAENNVNAIADPTQHETATTTIYIRVSNTQLSSLGYYCYRIVEQEVQVNPLPIAIGQTFPYCEPNTDGFGPFNLNSINGAVLGATQLPADYTVTYHFSLPDAQSDSNPLPSPYTNFVIDTQTIYVRVENNDTKCFSTAAIVLVVEEGAVANAITTPIAPTCDDDGTNDGLYTFDLTPLVAQVLGTQSATDYSINFYTSASDAATATNAINPISSFTTTTANAQTIWIVVTNTTNTSTPKCSATITTQLLVETLPKPQISSTSNVICVEWATDILLRGLVLDSGLSGPQYTFQWNLNGAPITGATAATYEIIDDAPGIYTVTVTSTTVLLCANDSAPFTVIQSGPAVVPTGTSGYAISNAFSDNQSITVNVDGYGSYLYSLDDGPRQVSNIFENVTLGSHTIYVWDNAGGLESSCDKLTIEDVLTIDYPHYFTPNGDGIHDTWNIVGLEQILPISRIYIFDRFGKLIKQISPQGQGWDGTYNGQQLPATDYWFTVDYFEQAVMKQFKAHFSLKR